MKRFKIMQEAGHLALARRGSLQRQGYSVSSYVPPKKVCEVEATDEWSALAAYVTFRYEGKQQYGGHRLEWSGSGASGATWRPDDGHRRRGRRWRMTVTLENGSYVHDIHLLAWESR